MTVKGHQIEVASRDGVAVITFTSPILAVETLEALASAIETLASADEPEPLVLHSANPRVFLAGAHLAEIARLDASSCAPYAHRGRRIIAELQGFPTPTVAAVDGMCSGGGFDIALACDVMVAGPKARFGHPGIRRGLITGWSGTTRLPAALGRAGAKAAVLETREIEADSLANWGGLRRVDGDRLAKAIEAARQLSSVDPARWHLWRVLRAPGFIDRFATSVVHKL
jgi:enoyl-CoA hydratase/carnithine racemase